MGFSATGILITGTDTGVGKTLVSAGLLSGLRGKGIRAGYMKPVQTGGEGDKGTISPDLRFVQSVCPLDDDPKLLNPYCFATPSAPSLAAELAGVKIEVEVIRQAFEELAGRYEIVLAEGAGGLLVPIWETYTFVDLARQLGLSLIVVGRLGLGTVNHTALTLAYARQAGLKVIGVILVQTHPHGLEVVEKNNPVMIEQFTGAKILGVIPYDTQINVEAGEAGKLAEIFPKLVDLDYILNNIVT